MSVKNLLIILTVAMLYAVLGFAAETPAPVQPLTLAAALDMAAHHNIDLELAKADSEEARARALQEAANLLPQILGTARQSRVFKVNLAAQGFGTVPGIEPILGPFNSFDARIQVTQKLLDVGAIQRSRSAKRAAKTAELQEDLARENVAAATALAYLEALRAQQAVTTALSAADLSEKLVKQVDDQRQAGSAAGIDVARARTRNAEEHLRVLQARSDVNDSVTKLKRLIGLPLVSSVTFSETFRFTEDLPRQVDEAVSAAEARRREMQIAQQRLEEEQLALSSEKWDRAPALSATGDYGLSGNEPSNSRPTGSIGAQVSVPILTSGKQRGREREALARTKAAEAQLADTRVQIEEDVRLAFDKLATSSESVKTSEQAVQLAQSELQMARDRFYTGVGENIDVVSAQTALARVEDSYIAALSNYQATRINLAMALGEAAAFHF